MEAFLTATGLHWRALEVSILLTDDDEMKSLNRRYRGRDRATNVLSFGSGEPQPAAAPDDGAPYVLGDIMLAFESVRGEAVAQEKPVGDHVRHLLVHGGLHLLGYDHEVGAEAEAMERLETAILSRLGVADPYLGPAGP